MRFIGIGTSVPKRPEDFAEQLLDFAQAVGIKDRAAAIRRLLKGLYSEDASKEESIIGSLSLRPATEKEAQDLRSVSGILPAPMPPELTVAEDINAISKDGFVNKDKESTRELVYQSVHRLQDKREGADLNPANEETVGSPLPESSKEEVAKGRADTAALSEGGTGQEGTRGGHRSGAYAGL